MSRSIREARALSQGAGRQGAQQGGFLDFFKAAVSVIPGVGPLASAALGAVQTRRQERTQRRALRARNRGRRRDRAIPVLRTAGPAAQFERFLPGGRTGFSVDPIALLTASGGGAPPGAGAAAGTTLACMKGFHPNKSTYFTQAGIVAKGTRCVKDRRRNALNPRALTRAVGRVKSAKKANKILGRITIRPAIAHHHHQAKKK